MGVTAVPYPSLYLIRPYLKTKKPNDEDVTATTYIDRGDKQLEHTKRRHPRVVHKRTTRTGVDEVLGIIQVRLVMFRGKGNPMD